MPRRSSTCHNQGLPRQGRSPVYPAVGLVFEALGPSHHMHTLVSRILLRMPLTPGLPPILQQLYHCRSSLASISFFLAASAALLQLQPIHSHFSLTLRLVLSTSPLRIKAHPCNPRPTNSTVLLWRELGLVNLTRNSTLSPLEHVEHQPLPLSVAPSHRAKC